MAQAQICYAQTLVPYPVGAEVYFGTAPRATIHDLIDATIQAWGSIPSDRDAMIWKIENRGDVSILVEAMGHPREFAD